MLTAETSQTDAVRSDGRYMTGVGAYRRKMGHEGIKGMGDVSARVTRLDELTLRHLKKACASEVPREPPPQRGRQAQRKSGSIVETRVKRMRSTW